MKHNYSGIIYVLLAAILFSIGGICIKMVSWSPLSINGARNLISCTLIFIYLKIQKHKIVINPPVLFGAVCMTGTTTLYVFANKMTTAANAIVLQFTAPIFVIFMSWLFFRKKPTKRDVIASCFVLIGIIFFFVDGLGTGSTMGNVLAVLSGVCYAGVFMLNSFERSDSLSSIFLGQVISAAIGIRFVFLETDFGVMSLTGIILLGVFQLALAYIFMAKGLEQINAVTASLTTAIEPILNPLIVAIFWHELIQPLSFVGAAIVIVSIVVYNVRQVQSAA